MTNGFYDLEHFSKKELVSFYRDAIGYGYLVRLEVQTFDSWQRSLDTSTSIDYYLNNLIDKKTHNVCINRSLYSEVTDNQYGEVGSSTLTSPSKFLYIYMSLEKLEELVKKYNLRLKNW